MQPTPMTSQSSTVAETPSNPRHNHDRKGSEPVGSRWAGVTFPRCRQGDGVTLLRLRRVRYIRVANFTSAWSDGRSPKGYSATVMDRKVGTARQPLLVQEWSQFRYRTRAKELLPSGTWPAHSMAVSLNRTTHCFEDGLCRRGPGSEAVALCRKMVFLPRRPTRP